MPRANHFFGLAAGAVSRYEKNSNDILPAMDPARVLISGDKSSDIMTHGMGPNPTEKAKM